MKKSVLTIMLALGALCMQGQSLGGLLNSIGNKLGTNNSDTTTTSASSAGTSSSPLGDLLGGLGKTVENLTSTTNFKVENLIGTWDYESPAVSMSSDNVISNIGGAAASATLENTLSEYYKTFGLDKMHLVVNDDFTFSMTARGITLNGTIEKDGEQLIFNFKAFGKVSLGKIKARATMSGTSLNLTFEAKKLLNLLTKVSAITNNSTLTTLNKLLSQYKDLYIGTKLRKTK